MSDTIFARASGAGQAAIAVVRLSGPRTADVLALLAGQCPAPRVASRRKLRSPDGGEVLDDALVIWFPGPASYTGEDAAELHLHGSGAVLAAVLAALVALGCRAAEPGEFTRRAVLHGRLDLVQAEGIADLIAAETELQRRQALRQADGALSRLYDGWTARATRVLAHQEAAIEFEFDDIPSDLTDQARVQAGTLIAEIAAHLADGGRGVRLREGVTIALVGAPNAGKSSLLNAIAGKDAAIVSARPGTTRDVVDCRVDLQGVPATLADTAGLRASDDEIEQEGVRRSRRRAEESDIVVAVFASDSPPDADTLAILERRPDAIAIGSKSDLRAATCGFAVPAVVVATSATTGEGVAELRALLAREAASRAGSGDAPGWTRLRHRAALEEAATRLTEALHAPLPELAAEGYRSALRALGRLTGRVEVDDVLDSIFRDFCIGK